MKILALDLGDVHIGSAISDISVIIAIPYKTIRFESLENFLKETIEKENIKTVVVGYPKTMKGKISLQTQKIIELKNALQNKFPDILWVFWDERLTSKMAEKLKKSKDKQDKLKLHSIAAALILESYLEFIRMNDLSRKK